VKSEGAIKNRQSRNTVTIRHKTNKNTIQKHRHHQA